MSEQRIHLVRLWQLSRESLAELARGGATGICIELERTRMHVQSVAEDALKLGLSAFGWIDAGPESALPRSAADRIRRLVEAYPGLDGYFISADSAAIIEAARELLPAYRLLPAPRRYGNEKWLPIPEEAGLEGVIVLGPESAVE